MISHSPLKLTLWLKSQLYLCYKMSRWRRLLGVYKGQAMPPLTVLRQFTASLKPKHVTCKQNAYLIKDLKYNLLGLPAITSLNLVSRLDSLHITAKDIQRQHPQLFHGLGTFEEEYEVLLVRCQAICSQLPLCNKVLDELNRIESFP